MTHAVQESNVHLLSICKRDYQCGLQNQFKFLAKEKKKNLAHAERDILSKFLYNFVVKFSNMKYSFLEKKFCEI